MRISDWSSDVCSSDLRDEARVELDRDVARRRAREAELAAQRLHQLLQLAAVEEVGRAAAQVHLDHIAVAVEQLGHQADLAVQPRQVRAGAGLLAGDDAVAAARSEEHTSELQSLMR